MKNFGCLINIKKTCSGFEIIKTSIKFKKVCNSPKAYTEKFDSSISRARTSIFDLVLNNDFKFFVTFTLKPRYFNLSLSELKSIVNDRIKYMRKKGFNDLSYILIPEKTKNR